MENTPLSAEERWLEAPDGTRLHYTVEGHGEIDFLLCDGIGCDGFIWRYLRPRLLERGRIIHLHMRGHGLSDPPVDQDRVQIVDLAHDWGGILQAEGIQRAVALGHSMGVQVSLELWHQYSEVISGLVLLCGSFENPVSTFHGHQQFDRLLPIFQRASRFGGRPLRSIWRRLITLPVAYHAARITEIHPDLMRRDDFEPYLEHLAQMDPALFFRMLGGAAAHSARSYLADIDVPVLVVSGSQDRFTPASLSEKMIGLLSDGEALEVPEGTHTAPIEHPVLINLTVTRFLDHHRLR